MDLFCPRSQVFTRSHPLPFPIALLLSLRTGACAAYRIRATFSPPGQETLPCSGAGLPAAVNASRVLLRVRARRKILESDSITPRGVRIAWGRASARLIAVLWFQRASRRIGKELARHSAAQIHEGDAQSVGWPIRTAISPGLSPSPATPQRPLRRAVVRLQPKPRRRSSPPWPATRSARSSAANR